MAQYFLPLNIQKQLQPFKIFQVRCLLNCRTVQVIVCHLSSASASSLGFSSGVQNGALPPTELVAYLQQTTG